MKICSHVSQLSTLSVLTDNDNNYNDNNNNTHNNNINNKKKGKIFINIFQTSCHLQGKNSNIKISKAQKSYYYHHYHHRHITYVMISWLLQLVLILLSSS